MTGLMGIDCGLSRVKAAIFDREGRKLAECGRPTPLAGDRVDAEELWQRAADAVRAALDASGLKAGEIAAVGFSGHGNGLYALDGEGRPLLAVSSMFAGSQPSVNELRASDAYARFVALTRQSAWSGQPLQILRWIKQNEPEAYRRVDKVLLCKDYLRYRLTGECHTDLSDADAAALWTRAHGTRDGELYSMLGVPEMCGRVPEAMGGDRRAGAVTAEAARLTGLLEGTPVACGAFDVCACMLGAGVAEPGRYSVTAGTWGVCAALPEDEPDLRCLTQECMFADGKKRVAIVSAPVSCVNLDWFLRGVRPELTYHEANEIAARYAPGDVRALYLPYLYRDMHKPSVPGGFVNLAPEDTWREMLRAVYEGVAFAHLEQLERMCSAGVRFGSARLSGGAANAELWRSLFADVLGLPVEITEEKQVGALAAAMLAAVSVGLYASCGEAAKAMARLQATYQPAQSGAYADKYRQFKRITEERKWTMA